MCYISLNRLGLREEMEGGNTIDCIIPYRISRKKIFMRILETHKCTVINYADVKRFTTLHELPIAFDLKRQKYIFSSHTHNVCIIGERSFL